MKLDGELAAIEREGTTDRLRWRRAASLGGREGRGLGADRARVRDQHPGHGRRRGADERERVRRRARRGLEWVDVCDRGRRRAPRAGSARLPYRRSNLDPGEVVSRASFAARRGRARSRSRPPWPRCAPSAARRSRPGSRPSARPSRTRTTRAPRAAAPGSCSTRPAAAGWRSAALGSPRSTPTSSRTRARRRPPTCSRLMAEGRRRVHERFGVDARARGPGAGPRSSGRRAGSSTPGWGRSPARGGN